MEHGSNFLPPHRYTLFAHSEGNQVAKGKRRCQKQALRTTRWFHPADLHLHCIACAPQAIPFHMYLSLHLHLFTILFVLHLWCYKEAQSLTPEVYMQRCVVQSVVCLAPLWYTRGVKKVHWKEATKNRFTFFLCNTPPYQLSVSKCKEAAKTTSPPFHSLDAFGEWNGTGCMCKGMDPTISVIGRKRITIMFSNITAGLCWRQDAYFVF